MALRMKTRPPRLVISGYYGFQNAGDEAVLLGLLDALRRLEPRLEAVVLSNSPEETARACRVRAVNRWNFREVVRAIRCSDLLISGGGSLFQDVTGLRSLVYYLGVMWLALLLGRPVVVYAQGIGPIRTWIGRCLSGLTLRRARAISVRDEDSRAFLANMGITSTPGRRVILAADPAWGLDRRLPGSDREAALALLRRNGLDCDVLAGGRAPLVGLAVREWLGLKAYKVALGRLAADLAAAGRQVIYLPFKFPEDITACREVDKEAGGVGTVLKEYLAPPQVLGLLAELDLLVGLRLHALILAAAVGTPVVAVSYDPKVDALCKALELPNAGRVETLSADALRAEVDLALRGRDEYRERLNGLQPRLAREAQSSAEMVVEVLRGRKSS